MRYGKSALLMLTVAFENFGVEKSAASLLIHSDLLSAKDGP